MVKLNRVIFTNRAQGEEAARLTAEIVEAMVGSPVKDELIKMRLAQMCWRCQECGYETHYAEVARLHTAESPLCSVAYEKEYADED